MVRSSKPALQFDDYLVAENNFGHSQHWELVAFNLQINDALRAIY